MPTPKFVFKRIALYVLLIFHFTKNSGQNQEVARATSQLMAVIEHRVKEKS